MEELVVIIRVHELYNKIVKLTERLSGFKRQTIGRRTEDSVLQLLELLIMAKHSPLSHKSTYLIKATASAEIIQFHLRSMLEQKLANETTVHQLLAINVEISRMLGGWRKSVQ